MSSEGSITKWLHGVKHGDQAAVEALWRRCFPDLVRFARGRLRGAPLRAADEEDVALSAMDSFYRAAQRGRFDRLADRSDLLRLLLRITARKAADLVRRETSQRRGAGLIRGDSGLADADSEVKADPAPTPELVAMVADECRRLLEPLDADLRALALAKMEGHTNEQIAERLQCSQRTVERRLHLLRQIWQGEAGE